MGFFTKLKEKVTHAINWVTDAEYRRAFRAREDFLREQERLRLKQHQLQLRASVGVRQLQQILHRLQGCEPTESSFQIKSTEEMCLLRELDAQLPKEQKVFYALIDLISNTLKRKKHLKRLRLVLHAVEALVFLEPMIRDNSTIIYLDVSNHAHLQSENNLEACALVNYSCASHDGTKLKPHYKIKSGDPIAASIGRMLLGNKTLRVVDMRNCEIGPVGLDSLLTQLSRNGTLQFLAISRYEGKLTPQENLDAKIAFEDLQKQIGLHLKGQGRITPNRRYSIPSFVPIETQIRSSTSLSSNSSEPTSDSPQIRVELLGEPTGVVSFRIFNNDVLLFQVKLHKSDLCLGFSGIGGTNPRSIRTSQSSQSKHDDSKKARSYPMARRAGPTVDSGAGVGRFFSTTTTTTITSTHSANSSPFANRESRSNSPFKRPSSSLTLSSPAPSAAQSPTP